MSKKMSTSPCCQKEILNWMILKKEIVRKVTIDV